MMELFLFIKNVSVIYHVPQGIRRWLDKLLFIDGIRTEETLIKVGSCILYGHPQLYDSLLYRNIALCLPLSLKHNNK